LFFIVSYVCCVAALCGQQNDTSYKKKVLEASELDVLFSYYNQDGQNAAVTGGELTSIVLMTEIIFGAPMPMFLMNMIISQ